MNVMNTSRHIIIGWVMATSVALAEPIQEPRPRLDSYDSYSQFIAAMYEYKKQIELNKRLADSLIWNIAQPEKNDNPDVSLMPIKKPQVSDYSSVFIAPLIISGPEDLELAITLANSLLQPIHTEKYRYNRTTFDSFPLRPLESVALEQEMIKDGLQLGFVADAQLKLEGSVTEVVTAPNQEIAQFSERIEKTKKTTETQSTAKIEPLIRSTSFTGMDFSLENSNLDQVVVTVSNR